MHYGGYACDMSASLDVARRRGVPVIEDAAHAPLARLDGRALGTFCAVGCFSFYTNKNLATGEGGMLVTDDDELARRARRMRCHGMSHVCADRHRGGGPLYDVTELGYNYRLDEMRAAIGLVQLNKLAGNNRRRAAAVARYRELLAPVEGVSVPFANPRGVPAHHIFPVVLDEDISRRRCIEVLQEHGIQTSVHYTPVHLLRYYRERFGCGEGMLPRTETVAARELTLPLHSSLTDESVAEIVKTLEQAVSEQRRLRLSQSEVVVA